MSTSVGGQQSPMTRNWVFSISDIKTPLISCEKRVPWMKSTELEVWSNLCIKFLGKLHHQDRASFPQDYEWVQWIVRKLYEIHVGEREFCLRWVTIPCRFINSRALQASCMTWVRHCKFASYSALNVRISHHLQSLYEHFIHLIVLLGISHKLFKTLLYR